MACPIMGGMPIDDATASWRTRAEFERHYLKHRRELGVRSRDAYLESARETIRLGRRFTYTWKGRDHVGYFRRQTRRLAALRADKGFILTHHLTSERRVQDFPGSTYN